MRTSSFSCNFSIVLGSEGGRESFSRPTVLETRTALGGREKDSRPLPPESRVIEKLQRPVCFTGRLRNPARRSRFRLVPDFILAFAVADSYDS